ncbi:MAG TPA: lipopolysaccharide biosynthesis protein [Polyangiales bacterium]
MGLAKVIAKALVWTSLESFALSGLSLISLVVFARLLTAEEFGVVAVGLAIVQLLTVPVELTFHDALIQRAEVTSLHVDSAFTTSLTLGSAFCAACWLLASTIERWVGQPGVGDVLRWMSLSLIGSGFGSVLVAMQRRKLEYRSLAIRSVIGRGGSAVVALALAFAGFGVWSLVVQQVLLVCLAAALLWVLADERPRLRWAWAPTRELLRYGIFTTAYQLLVIFISRIYMVLVGAYLGAESAGVLSLCFRGVDMLRDLLAGAVSQIAMPLFSRLRETREQLFEAYDRALLLTTLCTFPVFAGLSVCAPEVIAFAFGPQWAEAAPYFAVIALLAMEVFLRMYGATMLQAVGRPDTASVIVLAEVGCVVIGMFTVGQRSLRWALAVWVVRLVISVPIDIYLLKRVTGLGVARQLKGAWLPMLAATLMGAGVYLAKQRWLLGLAPTTRLWPMVALGALLYAGTMWLIGKAHVVQLWQFARHSLRRRAG